MREAKRISPKSLSANKSQASIKLNVADIQCRDRMRPVRERGVTTLMQSMSGTMGLQSPIQVRKVKHRNNELLILDGAHRLEAAKRLGWDQIAAFLWDCNDQDARYIELEANLSGQDLSLIDRGIFLCEWKRIYEEKNPETKQHVAGGKVTKSKQKSQISFVKKIAEESNCSTKKIEMLIMLTSRLSDDEKDVLQNLEHPSNQAELVKFGRLNDISVRKKIIQKLREQPQSRLKTVLSEEKTQKVKCLSSQDDKDFQKLNNLWSRSRKKTRKMFLDQHLLMPIPPKEPKPPLYDQALDLWEHLNEGVKASFYYRIKSEMEGNSD